MYSEISPSSDASGLRIAIVVSRYHERITGALRDAAVEAFRDAGGDEGDLLQIAAPGAFELVALSNAAAARVEIDAVVAIGCVITGETTHDRYICEAVARGLTDITLRRGLPIAFGLLTCQTLEQAAARAGGERGNKGREAMTAAIEAARAIRLIGSASVRGST